MLPSAASWTPYSRVTARRQASSPSQLRNRIATATEGVSAFQRIAGFGDVHHRPGVNTLDSACLDSVSCFRPIPNTSSPTHHQLMEPLAPLRALTVPMSHRWSLDLNRISCVAFFRYSPHGLSAGLFISLASTASFADEPLQAIGRPQ